MQKPRSASHAALKGIAHFGLSLLVLGSLTGSLTGHVTHAAERGVVRGVERAAPASPRVPPTAPGNLSITANGTTAVNIQWTDNSDNEDGFWLERSPDGTNNWTQVDTIAANVTSYDNAGLTCGTTYFYRLGAFNGDGESDYSNTASATTAACSEAGQRIFMPSMSKPALVTQAARLVDVSMSLYNAPDGMARSYYEGIIRYFADAVFEMTNGAHKIRRVSIYTNGQNADQANIIWKAAGQCWPNATIAGYTSKGARIEMCDSNSSGEPYATANDADQQNGGYTTAHEWGHFYYGISDEYKGSPNAQVFGGLGPLPGDVEVQNSVMTQQRNAILGTTSQGQTYNGDFNWLNFDTPLNNTGNNSQFRLYNASGWETLARAASADPRDAAREGYNPRDAYPELATYAPPAGQVPTIELPDGRTSARSDLQIVWVDQPANRSANRAGTNTPADVGDGVVRQIIIQSSASMTNGNKLDQVKAAVKDLVENAEIGDVLGIIHFDGLVTTTVPLTTIASQTTKDTIEAAIDAIPLGGPKAAIGDALQRALDGFTAAGILSDTERAVYLVADSANTTGRDPFNVIQTFANTFVSLHTFGFGTGGTAAEALQRLADQADGEYYFVADTTELSDAFSEADEASSPEVDTDIAQGTTTIAGGVPLSVPFRVDASIGSLEVDVSYAGALSSASVGLRGPSGASAGPAECDSYDVGNLEFETYCVFVVDAPLAGTWTLQANAPEDLAMDYAVVGASIPNTYTFSTASESANGKVLVSPAKMLIRAQAQKEWPITDVAISGTIELPNGTVQGLTLRDDGVAPDTLARDGIYMTTFSYTLQGDYFVTVRFNNHANTARYTQYSINLDGGPDGVQPPYREPWLIGEDFERVSTLQILVTQ